MSANLQQSVEIPLFPLGTVLFPGGSLQLRIFEPRYLDMIGRCMKANECFGVVGMRSGSEVGTAEFYSIGTLASITDWFEQTSGILGLTAAGTRRFEIDSVRRQRDGLYVGTGMALPSGGHVPLGPGQAWAADLVETLLGRVQHAFDLNERNLGDASWLSFRLAELLPLSVATKQDILETDDAYARLELLAELAVEIDDTRH